MASQIGQKGEAGETRLPQQCHVHFPVDLPAERRRRRPCRHQIALRLAFGLHDLETVHTEACRASGSVAWIRGGRRHGNQASSSDSPGDSATTASLGGWAPPVVPLTKFDGHEPRVARKADADAMSAFVDELRVPGHHQKERGASGLHAHHLETEDILGGHPAIPLPLLVIPLVRRSSPARIRFRAGGPLSVERSSKSVRKSRQHVLGRHLTATAGKKVARCGNPTLVAGSWNCCFEEMEPSKPR